MPSVERRKKERVDVRWPVRIHHPDTGCEESVSVNISGTDILFVSPIYYPIGDSIQIEIQLDGEQWIHCIASVVRAEPAPRLRYAYAAVVHHFSGDHQQTLLQRLTDLRSPDASRAA